jgi:hypothetical protein
LPETVTRDRSPGPDRQLLKSRLRLRSSGAQAENASGKDAVLVESDAHAVARWIHVTAGDSR